MIRNYIVFILVLFSCNANAETIYVKYRGAVDVSSFECKPIIRSSFIHRLCYDAKEQYVIVQLKSNYYHYCEVPKTVLSSWLQATSMGGFYNSYIKGHYDCRVNYMPSYNND